MEPRSFSYGVIQEIQFIDPQLQIKVINYPLRLLLQPVISSYYVAFVDLTTWAITAGDKIKNW